MWPTVYLWGIATIGSWVNRHQWSSFSCYINLHTSCWNIHYYMHNCYIFDIQLVPADYIYYSWKRAMVLENTRSLYSLYGRWTYEQRSLWFKHILFMQKYMNVDWVKISLLLADSQNVSYLIYHQHWIAVMKTKASHSLRLWRQRLVTQVPLTHL